MLRVDHVACSTGSGRAPKVGAALAVGLALAAACGRSEELEACNIDDRDCQEDVYYALIRARGDGFDPFDGVPPIRTLTRDQYRRELLRGHVPAAPSDPPAEPAIDPWDASLQRLGLLRPTVSVKEATSEDFAIRVGAFYTWATQTVTVVVDTSLRPADRDLRWETTLLAHELVHAFQDNESNLAVSDGSVDGDFAASTLIEGEARLYESLLETEMDKVSPQAVDWVDRFEAQVGRERAAVALARSRFSSVWTHAYPLGASAFMQRWLRGGNAAVRDLARRAPRRSIDYMAAHAGIEVTPAPALACRPTTPAPAFELVHTQRLGALQLHAFLMGAEEPHEADTGQEVDPTSDAAAQARAEALLAREPEAWRTALAWRDDQLFIYFDPEGQAVALTWRVRFASQTAAERSVAAANRLPALRAERRDRDALIVATDPGLSDWPGATECDR